ncbi:MAG: segregation/condensation protein A [Candidatus Aenigmarchaeota archaeon]|nr:segregation/condensation protein A [Candidatus Aenigmarchaeota archaeon]
MVEEESLLKMVLEKENWEEILYQVVSLENIDPWNVDLMKLTAGFLRYIRGAKELDFRIPAKIVFVAAILLRLKSDYLSIFEEKSAVEEALAKEKMLPELGIDPNLIKLGVPIKRLPKRQVTLDELIVALKRALDVRERKVERVQRIRSRLRDELKDEEDTVQRIEKVMGEIEEHMKAAGKVGPDGKLNFRDIVEQWDRDQIVAHLIPVLHLEKSQKISTEQPELFKDIFIVKYQQMTPDELEAAKQSEAEELREFDEEQKREERRAAIALRKKKG